jgi:CheY-like chemotaxis protein
VVSQLPERTRKVITDLHDIDVLFKGKKVLIVDDDMRTVFALSKILTAKGVITQKAENGAKALQLLENESDVDLVLMDIMMPVMDGYETMKRIRAQNKHKTLPIIALTAKAMRGDQELCIAAGANDYLTKPLDENRLYSMMRVWLYR